jgi:hypothetical protein
MRRRDTALRFDMAGVAIASLGSAAALVEYPVNTNGNSWAACAMHLVADASHLATPPHGVLGVRVDAPGSGASLWHAVAPAKSDVRIDVLGSYVCAMDPNAHKVWLLRLPSPDVEVVDIARAALATAAAPTVIGFLSQPPTSDPGVGLVDACLLPLDDVAAASFGVVGAFAEGSVVVYAVELGAPKLHIRVLRVMRPGRMGFSARVGRVTLDGRVHVAILDGMHRRILVCDDKGDVCRTFVPGNPASLRQPCDFAHNADQPSLAAVVTRSGTLLSYVDESTATDAVHAHVRRTFTAMGPKFMRVTALHFVAGRTLLTVGSGRVYRLGRTHRGTFRDAVVEGCAAAGAASATPPIVDLTCSDDVGAAAAVSADLTAQADAGADADSGGETTETEDEDDAMDGGSADVLDRALCALLKPQYAVHEF